MEELKEYRAALAHRSQIPIANVPPVSSRVIWERYAIEKAAYEDKSEAYKVKFKDEVNETFPHENRKAFAILEKSMSEASVEDVKRIPEGARAYEQKDAFAFLRLAMESHDFVPAQISDRACQNAQLRFESYRQPASATISEYLNEFRRRLDYYCKVRGDKAEDVYKDYQLKGLLLASLHPDAWGEWHRIRQLTSTMPATFEGVENALREEESARVLSSFKDPLADHLPAAAHATRVSGKAGATEPPLAIPCSECGTCFTPKRPAHHRCQACQKRFAEEKKKLRNGTKLPAASGPSTTVKGSRKTNSKMAHKIEAYSVGPDEEDDDDPTTVIRGGPQRQHRLRPCLKLPYHT